MSNAWVGMAVMALVLAAPYLLQRYVAQLPVAPSCPSCRAVTREASERAWSLLSRVPSLTATYVGECARCGWRGRLRWRWAPRRASREG